MSVSSVAKRPLFLLAAAAADCRLTRAPQLLWATFERLTSAKDNFVGDSKLGILKSESAVLNRDTFLVVKLGE